MLDGQDVGTLDEQALSQIRGRQIGFVFQSFHLVPRLTAAANVELPMVLAGIDAPVRSTRVARALDAVGLAGRAVTNRSSSLAASGSALPSRAPL